MREFLRVSYDIKATKLKRSTCFQPLKNFRKIMLYNRRKVTSGVLFYRKVNQTCFKYVHSRVAVCVNCGLCLFILWITWAPKQSLRYEGQIMIITWKTVVYISNRGKKPSQFQSEDYLSPRVNRIDFKLQTLFFVPFLSKYTGIDANFPSQSFWSAVSSIMSEILHPKESESDSQESCAQSWVQSCGTNIWILIQLNVHQDNHLSLTILFP